MRKLLAVQALLKDGRLVLRLLRDPRVPLYAKAVPGLALLYVLLPIDVVPDWIPVLGQLDDLAALLGAISLFFKLCPPDLLEEHEIALGRRPRRTIEGQGWPISPER